MVLRYARVNTLKTSVDTILKELQAEPYNFKLLEAIPEPSAAADQQPSKWIVRDEHINELLILGPPGIELHDLDKCKSMELILQDKASCFPAFVLGNTLNSLKLATPSSASAAAKAKGNKNTSNFDFIDACAAPGNKTTYLAALFPQSKVYAFDYTKSRFKTLMDRVKKAGGANIVQGQFQDFLKADVHDSQYANVRGALCDPSCSGSGIVSRQNCT